MNKVSFFFKILILVILIINSCKKEEKELEIPNVVLSNDVSIDSITLVINNTDFSYTNIGDTIKIYLPAGISVSTAKCADIKLPKGAKSDPAIGETITITSGIGKINVTAEDGKATKNYVIIICNFPYNSTIISSLVLTINNTDYNTTFTNDTAKITILFDGTQSDVTIKTILVADNATTNPKVNEVIPLTNKLGSIEVTAEDAITKKTYIVQVIYSFSSDYKACNIESLTIIKDFQVNQDYNPVLNLNYSVNTNLKFYRTNNTYGLYKAVITDFALYSNSVLVSTNTAWINSFSGKLTTTDPIQGLTPYKAVVKVNYYEKQGDQWIPLVGNFGTELSEQKEIEFTTKNMNGTLIPEMYLQYSYPINRQINFYKNEYNKGYYMFTYDPSKITQIKSISGLKVRYLNIPSKDTLTTVNTTYEAQTYTLWYDLPENLGNGKFYKAELLSENKVIHEIYFRVSNYNTVLDKIPSTGNINMFYDVKIPNDPSRVGYYLQYTYESPLGTDEYYEYYEIYGKNNKDPLLRRSLKLADCAWYQESYYKYIYEHYPVIEEANLTRDTSETGIPVTKPIKIWQYGFNRTLTDNEINTGDITFNATFAHYMVTAPFYWKYDYITTYKALHAKYSSDTQIADSVLKNIYNTVGIYSAKKGTYTILMEYVLPGKNIVTSSKELVLTNSIGDIY